MKIYLVGLSGSGKSFWASRIATVIRGTSLDMDTEIEQREGRTIREIFDNKGETFFREAERKLLQETSTSAFGQNLVVATGGGTPCFFEQMDLMKQHGFVIYLQATPAFLARRLALATDRPLLSGDEQQIASRLTEMLATRKKTYEAAHATVDVATATYDTFAGIIQAFIQK